MMTAREQGGAAASGSRSAIRAALLGLGVVVALSSFYVAPRLGLVDSGGQNAPAGTAGGDGPTTGNGPSGPQAAGGPAAAEPGAGGGGGSGGPAARAKGAQQVQCAPGKNGGATDVGVDAKSINLAATEVETGIGSSFLAPVRFGMLAVQQKVNRQGGICGRQLRLTMKDDGWSASLGKQYLDNFIQSQQYFALAVVPSSEGLNAASRNGSNPGDLDTAADSVTGQPGIPVVGTDGMLNTQYSDPWIWPVAASTATSMRIMAHDAHTRAAHDGQPQTYAIVYNQTYKFGVEGKDAFVAQVKRDGGSIPPGCIVALTAGQSSYKDQINGFNNACGGGRSDGGVSFVALLLEPQTAETWLQDGPYMGSRTNGSGEGAGGPQPLFDDNFGSTCGQTCANMEVWTSFYPSIFPYSQKAPVQTFKADLCAVDSHCDVDADSAFTEGGYEGMDLLVKALQQQGTTGRPLTRQDLAATLDSMNFDDGLSGPLAFRHGNHYANQTMVGFRDTFGQQFTGFQMIPGSQQNDPCSGCSDGSS